MLRAALLAGVLCATGAVAGAKITSARYADPTTRYDHGVLGDAVEWGALELTLGNGNKRRLVLPENRVFEDLEPRLADVDNDGAPEVIVVETDVKRGARLAIYGQDGLIAATPFIGRSHRWLAPLGAADLNGDGAVEIAYVDRPHLAKTLRVWRFADGTLTEIAALQGVTNHRIGDAVIWGGIRDCGAGAELVVADAAFRTVNLVRLGAKGLVRVQTGQAADKAGFKHILDCAD